MISADNYIVVEPLSRAYLALHLSPGASRIQIKKQYRRLARALHPDRFAGDPAMAASANRAMAEINAAYALLLAHAPMILSRDSAGFGFPPSPDVSEEEHGVRLSHEQIDDIVAQMNSSTSLWEALSEEPANRGVSLVIAVLHFLVWVGIGWLGLDPTVSALDKGASLAPVGSLVISGLFVPLIWYSESKLLRCVWWMFFLFFQFGMLGPLLGDPLLRRSALL